MNTGLLVQFLWSFHHGSTHSAMSSCTESWASGLLTVIIPGHELAVVFTQLAVLYLKPGSLIRRVIQSFSGVGQLRFIQQAHVLQLPGGGLLLLLQEEPQGGFLTLELAHALDVVGEAVIELSQVLLLLQAAQAGRAYRGRRASGGRGGAASPGARGAAG